jgi:hypothetical protein
VDELEALLWKYICERDKKSGIEDYGFGKGYQAALDEWRVFVAALERLRARRGMNVALIAHTVVGPSRIPRARTTTATSRGSTTRRQGCSRARATWCCSPTGDVRGQEGPNSKVERAKGVSTGARVIYTTADAGHDAKNATSCPSR